MKPAINIFLLLLILPALVFSQGGKELSADFTTLPSVKWKFKTRGPVFSSAVTDGVTVYLGSVDSSLYALDINTGNVKWTFPTRGEIRSNVIINNNQVLLLSGNGVFYSLDKNTGKVIWRKVFDYTAYFLGERKYDFADYYHSSPVLYNGIIYFGTGNGNFNAIKAENGETVWTFKANDIIHSTPVIYRDKIYFGSFDGNLYALNLQSGDLKWKFKTIGHIYFPKGEVQGFPAVSQKFGLIYVGTRDYNFYALDAENGYAHWNKKFDGGWALAASDNDSVVYAGTSDDRALVAFEAPTGRQLWRTDVKFNIFGECAFSKSMVYVATLMGKLFGIDRKTGMIQWSFETSGYSANHLRYFKPDDTFVDDFPNIIKTPYDYIGMEYKLGAIFCTPLIYNNLLIVTSTEGSVYCLQK